MHRDVKPSNILMDQNCGIHIIDFGLARRIAPTTVALSLSQSQDLASTPVLPLTPRAEPVHYSDDGSDEELESVAKKLKVKNTYNITQKAREIKETFSTEALDDVMVEIDLYGVDDDLFNGELLHRYTAFVESFFHSVATDRWREA